MGFGVAPAFDGDVGDGGTVLWADGGEECMHGRGIFKSEGVAGVEYRLGFGINGPVEKKNIGREGG